MTCPSLERAFERQAEIRGWRICNCAGCDRLITSRVSRGYRSLAGRIMGRPYCDSCLSPEKNKR